MDNCGKEEVLIHIKCLKPFNVALAIVIYEACMFILSALKALIELIFAKYAGPKNEVTHAIGFDRGSDEYVEDDDECEEDDCEDHLRRNRKIGF